MLRETSDSHHFLGISRGSEATENAFAAMSRIDSFARDSSVVKGAAPFVENPRFCPSANRRPAISSNRLHLDEKTPPIKDRIATHHKRPAWACESPPLLTKKSEIVLLSFDSSAPEQRFLSALCCRFVNRLHAQTG